MNELTDEQKKNYLDFQGSDNSEEYLFDVESVELEYLDLTGESILKFNIWPYDIKGYVVELSLNHVKSFCAFE